MRPHVTTAVAIVDLLHGSHLEVRVLATADPVVIMARSGERMGYVTVHGDGRATFLARTPELPLAPWEPGWVEWLSGGDAPGHFPEAA